MLQLEVSFRDRRLQSFEKHIDVQMTCEKNGKKSTEGEVNISSIMTTRVKNLFHTLRIKETLQVQE